MNILIGGSGFISNYLIKEFIDNGFNVTLIYNKTKPGLSHKNLSLLKTNLADREQVLKINNKLKFFSNYNFFVKKSKKKYSSTSTNLFEGSKIQRTSIHT